MKQNAYSQVFIQSNDYDSIALYKKRRKNLLKKIDAPCVLAGVFQEPGAEEPFNSTWVKFIQDPAFIYYTGVNQENAYLLLDPKNQTEILFVPKKDLFKEFWTGKKLGIEKNAREIAKLTGIKKVLPSETFEDFLKNYIEKNEVQKIYSLFYPKIKNDHNAVFLKKLKRISSSKIQVMSIAGIHFAERLILEKERIEDAKMAQKITQKAFENLLLQIKNFKTERMVSLFLNYEMQKNSDSDLAFPTIAASGENACCLHYTKNDEALDKNQMILLDFGVRYNTLHSDISRTIPLSGKFNPLQKLLYKIVFDASLEYQKFVRPGVSLNEIGMVPWDFIYAKLEEELVQKHEGKFKLLYDKKPHGVSHFIGEQIHEGDPSKRSLDVVLKPGMFISCEPGVYGTFEGQFDGKIYREKIGIRLEDDLLITEKGFENLSKKIPKSIEEIEKWMKK